MATPLFGSMLSTHDTLPRHARGPGPGPASRVPAGEAQVIVSNVHDEVFAGAAPSTPPPPLHVRPTRPWPALPAMTLGLLWTAVVWLGLAIVVVALVYPFSIGARFWLVTAGTWFMAGGIAYALTARPETA